MLVFPRGNNTSHISVYLDAPEAAWMPQNLTPKATFWLTLINHSDPTKSFVKGRRRAGGGARRGRSACARRGGGCSSCRQPPALWQLCHCCLNCQWSGAGHACSHPLQQQQ
jgi:hypothetical protein